MTKFQWDLAKYPIKQSLKNISDIIAKVCVNIFYKNFIYTFEYTLPFLPESSSGHQFYETYFNRMPVLTVDREISIIFVTKLQIFSNIQCCRFDSC